MRRAFGRVVVGTVLGAVGLFAGGGTVLAATPQTPGPEPGSPEQMAYFADTCRHELQRPPVGGVENTTSPGPGKAVAGDVIDVNLTWDPADWNDTWVEKVLNCASVDGKPVPELSDEERPAPNDGAYARELTVPDNMEGGHLLCEQGFVYGVLSRGGYSLTSSPRVGATGGSPLSAAELRLLPYLQTHLTIREIGERLFVSRNTVNSQVGSIYRKLGVSSRNDAVQTATTIGLLGG